MWYKFGSYTYDSDSQFFFKGGVEEAERLSRLLKDHILHGSKTVDHLLSLNAEHVEYTTKFVTRAGICLTYNCNLRCAYCSDSSHEGMGDSVSVEDVDVFIGEIMKRWTVRKLLDGTNTDEPLIVYITGGGEPTYDLESLKKIVQVIRDKSAKNDVPVQISVTSNGVCGNAAREFLATNIDRIMISYDGLPEIQDKNRRTATNHKTNEIVEETIRYLLANEVSDLTVRTTLWYEDISRLKEMADYVFSHFHGKFVWSLFPVSPLGRALDHLNTEADYNNYDFASAYVALRKYVADNYDNAVVESSFFVTTKNVYYCGGMSCSLTTPWLVPGGDVLACLQNGGRFAIAHIENGHIVMGNVHVDPLLRMAQEKLQTCKECLVYRFCQGGCPAQHIANEQNGLVGRPWSCEMFIRYGRIMLEKILSGDAFEGWCVDSVDLPELESDSVLQLKRKD